MSTRRASSCFNLARALVSSSCRCRFSSRSDAARSIYRDRSVAVDWLVTTVHSLTWMIWRIVPMSPRPRPACVMEVAVRSGMRRGLRLEWSGPRHPPHASLAAPREKSADRSSGPVGCAIGHRGPLAAGGHGPARRCEPEPPASRVAMWEGLVRDDLGGRRARRECRGPPDSVMPGKMPARGCPQRHSRRTVARVSAVEEGRFARHLTGGRRRPPPARRPWEPPVAGCARYRSAFGGRTCR